MRNSFTRLSVLILVAVCAVPGVGNLPSRSAARGLRRATADPKAYVCPPCGLECDKRTFDRPGTCPECGMKLVEKGSIKTVAVLLFDHVQIIDYAGPWEVFGEAGFKVFTVAERPEPITSVFSQRLTPDYTFENSPRADILLVPGGGVGDASNNPKLIKWLQDNAKTSDYVMSVCTGAFLLAKAGLLDGLTATTVRGGIDRLATVAPKTKVVYDQRYVDNGKIITTAGLSSGIDGAFHLLAKTLGEGQAESTALGMEYKWDPESKYARAALPDRYLPGVEAFQGKMLANHGDMDHWEIRGIVSEPDSLKAIMELMAKQVESTPHTRSSPKLAARTSENELRWTLIDERGGNWSGSAVAEPAPDEKGQFIVTVKLARENR